MTSYVWSSSIAINEFFACLVFDKNVAICSNNLYNIYDIPNEVSGKHNIGNIILVYWLEKKQESNGNIAEK